MGVLSVWRGCAVWASVRSLWAILKRSQQPQCPEETPMKVSDILRVKGGTLYTVTPKSRLADAAATMAERDIGSLVVMDAWRRWWAC